MHVNFYIHTYIHSFIHNFFSVDRVHPDLLNGDRLWEFNEKNIIAWAKVITSLFSAIMESVNQSFSYYNLKEKFHDMIKDLQKSMAPEATVELM